MPTREEIDGAKIAGVMLAVALLCLVVIFCGGPIIEAVRHAVAGEPANRPSDWKRR